MEAVRSAGISGNVVDFVVAKLRKLPTRRSGSCNWRRASATRSICGPCRSSTSDRSIHRRRSVAGATAIHGHSAKRRLQARGQAGAGGVPGRPTVEGLNPTYRFQHDRVQQAAYALIDEDRKQAVNLSIGRLIQSHASVQEREERLIEIVGHLNNGRRLIDNPDQRKELARLNLAAGIQAQRSSAYEAALGYLRIGQELLPPDRLDERLRPHHGAGRRIPAMRISDGPL